MKVKAVLQMTRYLRELQVDKSSGMGNFIANIAANINDNVHDVATILASLDVPPGFS